MPRPIRSTKLLYALPMLAGAWFVVALLVAVFAK